MKGFQDFDEDELMMTTLDAGALDLVTNDDTYEIYTLPEDFLQVKEAIEKLGVTDFLTSEITYIADNEVEVADEETKEKVYKLVEVLEDIDDVQDVYNNMSE